MGELQRRLVQDGLDHPSHAAIRSHESWVICARGGRCGIVGTGNGAVALRVFHACHILDPLPLFPIHVMHKLSVQQQQHSNPPEFKSPACMMGFGEGLQLQFPSGRSRLAVCCPAGWILLTDLVSCEGKNPRPFGTS